MSTETETKAEGMRKDRKEPPESLPVQRIYYDDADAQADGKGWNVVDAFTDGGIAARFDDVRDAVRLCQTEGFPFYIDEPIDGLGLDYDEDEGWVVLETEDERDHRETAAEPEDISHKFEEER